MPTASALPERELQIAKRLRYARKQLLISQTLFAMKVEISQARLAKYELGLVPLPWEIGKAISSVYHINSIWLGTGQGDPWSADWHVDNRLPEALGTKPLFSQVVDEILIPLAAGKSFSEQVQRAVEATDPAALATPGKGTKKRSGKPIGPFLSSVQFGLWDMLAWGPLRTAFSGVRADDLEAFYGELAESIEKIAKRYHTKGPRQ